MSNLLSECTDKSDSLSEKVINKLFTIHPGHNPYGRIASGANGLFNESKENRKLYEALMKELSDVSDYLHFFEIPDGNSQKDILERITKEINLVNAPFNLSLHYNASSNPDAHGVEMLVHPDTSFYNRNIACDLADELSNSLGITNREIKENPLLYILKHTVKPTVILEICFCTSQEDAKKHDIQKEAEAIAKVIRTYLDESEIAYEKASPNKQRKLYHFTYDVYGLSPSEGTYLKETLEAETNLPVDYERKERLN